VALEDGAAVEPGAKCKLAIMPAEAEPVEPAEEDPQMALPMMDTAPEDPEGPEAPEEPAVLESEALELVEVSEAYVAKDGRVKIRVIAPGEGSSAYYPADVLKRDGPQVFTKGTQAFVNHQSRTEEAERPEGSVHDLIGSLSEDAHWEDQGEAGPGLYSFLEVVPDMREWLNNRAKHVGMSIRAAGMARRSKDQAKPTMERLTFAKSVDVVTRAGAGGVLIPVRESADEEATVIAGAVPVEEQGDLMQEQLNEALARISELEAQNTQLKTSLIEAAAKAQVAEALAVTNAPVAVKERVAARALQQIPLTEGAIDIAALNVRVDEALKAEMTYLREAATLTPAKVVGFGSTEAVSAKESDEERKARIKATMTRLHGAQFAEAYVTQK
jgi:hypothetical protein